MILVQNIIANTIMIIYNNHIIKAGKNNVVDIKQDIFHVLLLDRSGIGVLENDM